MYYTVSATRSKIYLYIKCQIIKWSLLENNSKSFSFKDICFKTVGGGKLSLKGILVSAACQWTGFLFTPLNTKNLLKALKKLMNCTFTMTRYFSKQVLSCCPVKIRGKILFRNDCLFEGFLFTPLNACVLLRHFWDQNHTKNPQKSYKKWLEYTCIVGRSFSKRILPCCPVKIRKTNYIFRNDCLLEGFNLRR